MPKGMIEDTTTTSITRLREMIHDLEIGAGEPRGQGSKVFDLLKMRDSVEAEVQHFQEVGRDVRPERTRLETVDNLLLRKGTIIDRELRALGGLTGARREVNPPDEHWWWFLDLYWAEKQRKGILRTGIILVAALVVVLGLNWVMNHFFGMDPVEKQARAHMTNAEIAMRNGKDIDQVIAEYEQAVAIQPSLGEAQVALQVLYEAKGETTKSQAAAANAQAAYGDRGPYLITLAQAYQQMDKLDQALTAAEEAVKLQPDSAEAVLIRGGVYESKGDNVHALQDYDKAGSLAQASGQDAIYVLARTRMGMLMQRGGPGGLGSPGGGF